MAACLILESTATYCDTDEVVAGGFVEEDKALPTAGPGVYLGSNTRRI